MKKTYMNPSVKEVKIRMEQHVCAGSDKPIAGGEYNGGTDGIGAKEDDFDTWGW